MNRKWQPLDRMVWTWVGILLVLIGFVLWSGDRTLPKVREFSWQNKQVSALNTAFTLSFNRPMDWPAVEDALKITPELPGKVSWSGKRLAYTLLQPIPYGQKFQVQVAGAREKKWNENSKPKVMQSFSGAFQSRDRAFIYLGSNSQESGRLILSNLTHNKKTILTPENLVVSEFYPYPYSDRILFAATEKAQVDAGNSRPQLYTVSTGLQVKPPEEVTLQPPTKPGTVKLLLDNKNSQILKFALSEDGERIVLQQAPRQPTGGFGQVSLWHMPGNGEGAPELIKTQPGGDFLIAPDGQTLVMAQGQGLALIPLAGQSSSKPLDFLPQFGMVLSFTQDGSAAAMVKFNTDFTRSLFFVTNQGVKKELLRIKGSILEATFDPQKQFLYCVLTRLLPGADYMEQPYLAKVDLSTGQQTPLLDVPVKREISISLAPDGSSLLFSQSADSPTANREPTQPDPEEAPPVMNIRLLPLSSTKNTQQTETSQILTQGTSPRWL